MSSRTLIAAITVISVTSAAGAQESNSCHGIADGAERLSCYDEQTGFAATAAEEVAGGEGGGQWLFQEETSGIDGRRDVWLSVMSQNTQPGTLGRQGSARLWVRCMQNSTNVFITFNAYTTDDQQVRYRLDDRAAASVYMETMRGGDGIGIWSGGRAIPFARSLFDANTLLVEYSSYEHTGLEFEFDVSGLRERIGPLAEACNWRP